MAIISRPTIPEIYYERIKTDVLEFPFNFFEDGVAIDVTSRTYKLRFRASGIQVLEKSPTTNTGGRLTFLLSTEDKVALSGSDFAVSLAEVITGGEKTLLAGTLTFSVKPGKATGLVAPPDVSVNYITATDELFVALGIQDFGSASSAANAALSEQSAQLSVDKAAEIVSAAATSTTKATEAAVSAATAVGAAGTASSQAGIATTKAAEVVSALATATNGIKVVGYYNASTGIATIRNTSGADVNFTPGTVPTLPDGQSLKITTEGTQSIEGAQRLMKVGGSIDSRGVKWDYTPPADTGYQRTLSVENFTDDSIKTISGKLLRNLAAPLTFTRNTSTGSAAALGNMGQVRNLDRSVQITGYTDLTIASHITDMQTGISAIGLNKISVDFTPSAIITVDPLFGVGFVSGSERIIFLWRPTGYLAYTKTATSTFSQLLGALTAREYVVGDQLRMELVITTITTINLYKANALIATTTYSAIPTGDIIIGMRGSMSLTYKLTTEQTGDIANNLAAAKTYADSKTSVVQTQVNNLSIDSVNLLPPLFTSGFTYRNSDGALGSTSGAICSNGLIPVLPNTTYTLVNFHCNFPGNEYSANVANTANRVRAIAAVVSGALYVNYTFTTSATTTFLGLNLMTDNVADTTALCMLVLGSVAPSKFQVFGDKYVPASKVAGDIPSVVDLQNIVDGLSRNSVNLMPLDFTSGTTYGQSNGNIVSAGTPVKRTTNLIPVLPNTVYTVVNFNTNFIGNEYSANVANTANRVRVIAAAVTGVIFTTFTFTTSSTTTFLGLNPNYGSLADTSDRAMLVLGAFPPSNFESKSGKFLDGTKIRGAIPGVDAPALFYSFSLAGYNDTETGATQGTGAFYIYCKYATASPYYARYQVGHVLNSTIRGDVWRIIGAELFKWDGSQMVDQMVQILNTSESECVFLESGKTDFTGGYHGDELLTEVFFYVGGVRITNLSADIPLTPASDFWYIQKSNMYETDNVTNVLRAVHHKNTRFNRSGYTTKNRIIWSGIVNVNVFYAGLLTITHAQSGTIYTEEYEYATTTAPSTSVEKLSKTGLHEMYYFNTTTRLSAYATSKITKALDVAAGIDRTVSYDASARQFVRDITNYAKYYRGLEGKTTAVNEIWEGETTFWPSRL